MKSVVDRLLDNSPHADALLPSGGLDGPETLAPLLALCAAGALGDASIDHAKAQGAFGDIVGRVDWVRKRTSRMRWARQNCTVTGAFFI